MTGPLSDQHLDEATALLGRLDAVPSMGYLDSADLGWVRPVLHDLLDEVRRLRGENERLTDLAKDHWQESEGEFDRGAASARRAAELAEEVIELRTRIGNARSEIARQDAAATHGMRPGYCDVSDALAAVETHLVDPEYRPVSGPAGDGSAA